MRWNEQNRAWFHCSGSLQGGCGKAQRIPPTQPGTVGNNANPPAQRGCVQGRQREYATATITNPDERTTFLNHLEAIEKQMQPARAQEGKALPAQQTLAKSAASTSAMPKRNGGAVMPASSQSEDKSPLYQSLSAPAR